MPNQQYMMEAPSTIEARAYHLYIKMIYRNIENGESMFNLLLPSWQVLWYAIQMNASLYFHGGTLVLQDVGEQTELDLPTPFVFVKGKWRCEAYYFQELQPWLRTVGIRTSVPRWQRLALSLHDQ